MRQRGVLSLLAAQFFIYEKGGKGGCGLLMRMERSRKNDFEQGRKIDIKIMEIIERNK